MEEGFEDTKVVRMKDAREQRGLQEIHFDPIVQNFAEVAIARPVLLIDDTDHPGLVENFKEQVHYFGSVDLQKMLKHEIENPGNYDSRLLYFLAKEYLGRSTAGPTK